MTGTKRIGCLLTAGTLTAAVAALAALAVLAAAVTIGTAAAWFLHLPFTVGFRAVCNQPFKAVVYAGITGTLLGGTARRGLR